MKNDSTKKTIDCLFIHVPKFSNYYKPLDDFMNVTYMPMGVFALADIVASHGFTSRIVHLGVEWIEDKNFSIIEYIRNLEVKIVAMPLFWHYQSYDVIEVVKKIKKSFPEIYIVLGGFTASYFAVEILNNFQEVDGIIKGRGEESILPLVREISASSEGNLHEVPNLCWRDKNKIILNDNHYVACRESIDNLRFTDLSLLKNYPTYVKCFSFPLAWMKNFSKKENYEKGSIKTTLFPLFIGTGCPVECSWCGGGSKAQKKMNFDNRIIFRSPEKVIESIKEAQKYGYETMHVCFDPSPQSDYYPSLFKKIRENNIKIGLYFESWALPTLELIREFKKTFDIHNSRIAISPETGSEKLRKLNRGFPFSNRELFKTLDFMEVNGVNFDVFFTIGLPFEKITDTFETKRMIKSIRRKYRRIWRLMTWSVQLEPGSPIFENPKKFGIETERRCFMDFYRSHAGCYSDTYSALGYNIPDYFQGRKCPDAKTFSEKIQKVKCRHFCFLHPDPRKSHIPSVGRLYCWLRRISWILKGRGKKNLAFRGGFK